MGWFSRKKADRRKDHQTTSKPETGLRLENLEDRLVPTTSNVVEVTLSKFLGTDGILNSSLSRLNDAYHDAPVREAFKIEDIVGSQNYSYLSDGRISITARSAGDSGRMFNDLAAIGMSSMTSLGEYVTGWVGIDKLDTVRNLESVRYAKWDMRPQTDVGIVANQADPVLRSDLARTEFGVDGTGVTIGIISDSFDALNGYTADVGSGDLPIGIQVLSDIPGTDEGRAMAQLIHDIAPGARLMFHTSGTSQQSMAVAIERLAEAGADIIVDDVRFFDELFFQENITAQTIDRVVNSGIVYVSSAGNYAGQSWQDVFNSSGIRIADVIPELSLITSGELHDFNPGPETNVFQPIIVPPLSLSTLIFQWDNSAASATDGRVGATDDYDLILLNEDGEIIDFSADSNRLSGEPVEILNLVNDQDEPITVFLAIVNKTGGQNILKYVWRGSDILPFEFASGQLGHGTSYGHAYAVGNITVAAAPWYDPLLHEDFSSRAGIPIYFDNDGNRLVGEVRIKPNVTGIDGVNTTFFGGDISQDADFFPNFFGTSAAAPNVAAVAALMLDAVPEASPRAVRTALERSALDLDDWSTPGFDFGHDIVTGWGLVRADFAISMLQDMRTVLVVDVSESMVSNNSLDINGDGMLTELDDLDLDGTKGSALDQALNIVRNLDRDGFFLPNVSLIVFGRDAKMVDLLADPGTQSAITYQQGQAGSLLGVFRKGEGGRFALSQVDASRSYYDVPMNLLLGSKRASEYVEAVLITDGSGLLASSSVTVNALASNNVVVNSYIVGNYYAVGSISGVQRLVDGTEGAYAVDTTPVIVDNAVLRPKLVDLGRFVTTTRRFDSSVRLDISDLPFFSVSGTEYTRPKPAFSDVRRGVADPVFRMPWEGDSDEDSGDEIEIVVDDEEINGDIDDGNIDEVHETGEVVDDSIIVHEVSSEGAGSVVEVPSVDASVT